MNKIPTLYVRDPANMSRVTQEVTPGCEWVLAGEGVATRKWDGTNIAVTIHDGKLANVEKRRNPSREEKAAGAEPSYVDASRTDPADKHIFAAVDATDFSGWPNGGWSCEALGPKIQGGADGAPASLLPFSLPDFAQRNAENAPRDFSGLAAYLAEWPIEGLVWHHPDGRMVKIKRRDFGHRWPVPA